MLTATLIHYYTAEKANIFYPHPNCIKLIYTECAACLGAVVAFWAGQKNLHYICNANGTGGTANHFVRTANQIIRTASLLGGTTNPLAAQPAALAVQPATLEVQPATLDVQPAALAVQPKRIF